MLTAILLVCAAMALTTTDGYVFVRNNCPAGWVGYNNNCYNYVAKVMTWARAERNCLFLGGNLASVHSLTEHQQVQSIVAQLSHGYGNTWLGASDAQQEGLWFWSDGTSFQFSQWCPGEPNNHKQQHCLQMNFSTNKCWDDLSCWAQLPSLCQKRA